ncbi:MAG: single-stranded DNA-binding protein [Chloroflexi bacterium]|nr:single-stranded DNA-binding protein [Chloroflexota bacterium]
MPYSLNRVDLIGRLGHDAEMRFTADGQPMTRFSLATDRPAAPGAQAETDWHHIICWRKLAEFAGQYLAKGRLVYVAGRLTYRTREERDGQKRRIAEIVATEILLLDRRPEADARVQDTDTEARDDDTPF